MIRKKNIRKFLLAGVTGGIAAGKSTVSKRMELLGASVIDADKISREVVGKGTPALKKIKKAFPENIVCPDGSLNRKALADIVFKDKRKMKELERVVHPLIIAGQERIIEKLILSGFKGILIVDAALLIETGYFKKMDKVIVVTADRDIQLKRLIDRDKISTYDAEARIDSQMPVSEKIKYADHVIENNGSKEELYCKVADLFLKIAPDE